MAGSNIRDIKRRIDSVKSTQQITKAMKMVSAARLRKAQANLMSARPFAQEIDELVSTLAAKTNRRLISLLREAEDIRKIGLLIVTGDKGLCGSFNMNIIKTAEKYLNENNDKEIELILVGKKAVQYFSKREYPIAASYKDFFNNLSYADSERISDLVIKSFSENKYDSVMVVYNEFKNAIQQNLILKQLLPIKPIEQNEEIKIDYLYEPSPEVVLERLLPKHLSIQVWRMLLESNASEHGARMSAMDAATDNASELIGKLTLTYNRSRQAAITTEILEIVSGAEALRKG